MAEQPNDASRKSKAEGDRWSPENETASERSEFQSADEQSGGITNRPLDEEMSNQQAVPPRGESKPGAHAGHGDPEMDADMDTDSETERSER